jgi:hypothetical protein
LLSQEIRSNLSNIVSSSYIIMAAASGDKIYFGNKNKNVPQEQ